MGARAERLERRLQVPMLVAAVLVIPDLVLEEAHVSATAKTIATVLNWATWLAFVAELVAMLTVVRDRRAYLRHNPLNLVVTVLTPPFLPAFFQSLRLLRILRVLRLLRLAPLFRVAFTLRGVEYASVFAGLVAVTGAAAFELVEPDVDYFDSFYWAITTMTTVGYGTPAPTTVESKIVAMALMVVGIGYFAVVTGALADAFIKRDHEIQVEEAEAEAPDDLAGQVDRLTLHAQELVTELEALRLDLDTRRGRT
jgi:voltage-gated potassium channel